MEHSELREAATPFDTVEGDAIALSTHLNEMIFQIHKTPGIYRHKGLDNLMLFIECQCRELADAIRAQYGAEQERAYLANPSNCANRKSPR